MSSRSIWFTLIGIAMVAALGSVLDVMEVDAAQYAGMARDMLTSDDWTRLYFRGTDYLDKPPLHFWLSALSYRLFGVSNWSYKLPSIAFAFLALYSTYRFALLHHGRDVAQRAALMLGASAAFLLMTNDVRCDTILTGAVITAIWLGSAFMEQGRWWQLIGASVAVAAGMLAKGPIGLVAPMLALGADLILRKRWPVLRDWRLLLTPVVVAVMLLPMSIGLYEQHGAHGLRFYFWEQSFGRITGENRWKDDSTVLFFTHELLWQLLPWTLFVLLGIWQAATSIAKRTRLNEYASIGGAVLVFIALSLSRFKLPHYLYVALPLFAVSAALAWPSVQQRWVRVAHLVVVALLAMAALALCAWSLPHRGWPLLIVLLLVALWRLRSNELKGNDDALFNFTCQVWLVAGIALNAMAYPQLLKYQDNAHAGRWAAVHGLDERTFYGMQVYGPALDFYAGFHVPWLSDTDEARAVIAPGVAVYTDRQRYQELLSAGLVPVDVDSIPSYSVQMLGLDFVIPDRREQVVSQRYLLRY